MSKKETIEDKVKSLTEREEQIKLQLDADSGEMKEKFFRIGKIALVTGVVAALGFMTYNAFFRDEEDDPEEEKKFNKKSSDGFFARIGTIALPYIEKAIDGAFNINSDTEQKDSDN